MFEPVYAILSPGLYFVPVPSFFVFHSTNEYPLFVGATLLIMAGASGKGTLSRMLSGHMISF